jgi:hypothetical protein
MTRSIRVVSMVHALIIIPLAFRALHVPALEKDRAFGWDDRHGTLAAVACGYASTNKIHPIIDTR